MNKPKSQLPWNSHHAQEVRDSKFTSTWTISIDTIVQRASSTTEQMLLLKVAIALLHLKHGLTLCPVIKDDTWINHALLVPMADKKSSVVRMLKAKSVGSDSRRFALPHQVNISTIKKYIWDKI